MYQKKRTRTIFVVIFLYPLTFMPGDNLFRNIYFPYGNCFYGIRTAFHKPTLVRFFRETV